MEARNYLRLKFFFVATLVSCTILTNAQDYQSLISENKLWKARPGGFFAQDYYSFFDGDTLLGGNSYNILKKHPVANPNDTTVFGYLREDLTSQRVYYYDTTNSIERLLYDFDVEVGDLLSILPTAYWASPLTYIVLAVDSVQFLNGDYRKRIRIESYSCNGQPECMDEYWYEGMGSQYGVMGVGQGPLLAIDGGCCYLRCYYENFDLQFTSGNSCTIFEPPYGDLNGDFLVDENDFQTIVDNFGCSLDCIGDLDGDGIITIQDLILLIELIE